MKKCLTSNYMLFMLISVVVEVDFGVEEKGLYI